METEAAFSRHPSSRDAARRFAHGIPSIALEGLRWIAFGILALFRPLVIPILSWLAVGGLAIWLVFVPIAHDSDFPTLQVLGMSLGCAAGAVVYYALMEWLRPGFLNRGR
jgi:hypothetical protein